MVEFGTQIFLTS